MARVDYEPGETCGAVATVISDVNVDCGVGQDGTCVVPMIRLQLIELVACRNTVDQKRGSSRENTRPSKLYQTANQVQFLGTIVTFISLTLGVFL